MDNNTIERRRQVRQQQQPQQQQPQQQAQQYSFQQSGDPGVKPEPKLDAWQSLANAQARKQLGDL